METLIPFFDDKPLQNHDLRTRTLARLSTAMSRIIDAPDLSVSISRIKGLLDDRPRPQFCDTPLLSGRIQPWHPKKPTAATKRRQLFSHFEAYL